jgi:outer membrane protein TolC
LALERAAESRRETQTVDWPPASPKYGEYPYYSLGFDASWELDLFGETRRRKESAQAAADAAVEDAPRHLGQPDGGGSEQLSELSSDRVASANRPRESRYRPANAKLAHHAFESGERSHLDVSEADGRVHGVEATIPPLQAHADELTHALAILLAQAPAQFETGDLQTKGAMPEPPPLPPSLPSEVIAQRPDIRGQNASMRSRTPTLGLRSPPCTRTSPFL